jgi:hypothetical protein
MWTHRACMEARRMYRGQAYNPMASEPPVNLLCTVPGVGNAKTIQLCGLEDQYSTCLSPC